MNLSPRWDKNVSLDDLNPLFYFYDKKVVITDIVKEILVEIVIVRSSKEVTFVSAVGGYRVPPHTSHTFSFYWPCEHLGLLLPFFWKKNLVLGSAVASQGSLYSLCQWFVNVFASGPQLLRTLKIFCSQGLNL